MKNLEEVKKHIANHKRVYIIAGAAVGVAAIGVGGYILGAKTVPKVVDMNVAPSQAVNGLSWKPTQNMTTNIHIEALGDPGNIIQDLTTGTIYASQGQAAKALGVEAWRISKQLSGASKDVNGHTFAKLGKAMVSQTVAE